MDRVLIVLDEDASNDTIQDKLDSYTTDGWVVVSNDLLGDKRFIYLEL